MGGRVGGRGASSTMTTPTDITATCVRCVHEVSKETLNLHQRKHTECVHPGCEVVGTPQVLQSHFDFAHGLYAAPGYHLIDMRLVPTTEVAGFRILAGEDPTLVEAWRTERRTRFPTRARLADLGAMEARKQARLNRLEARQLEVALGTTSGRKLSRPAVIFRPLWLSLPLPVRRICIWSIAIQISACGSAMPVRWISRATKLSSTISRITCLASPGAVALQPIGTWLVGTTTFVTANTRT